MTESNCLLQVRSLLCYASHSSPKFISLLVEGHVGLEPTTISLTGKRSTLELMTPCGYTHTPPVVTMSILPLTSVLYQKTGLCQGPNHSELFELCKEILTHQSYKIIAPQT